MFAFVQSSVQPIQYCFVLDVQSVVQNIYMLVACIVVYYFLASANKINFI